MNKLFRSSANPENTSLSIKGAFVGLIPIIIILAGQFGIPLNEVDLVQLIEALLLATSSVMVLFGLCRKLYFYIKSRLK